MMYRTYKLYRKSGTTVYNVTHEPTTNQECQETECTVSKNTGLPISLTWTQIQSPHPLYSSSDPKNGSKANGITS